LNHPKKKARKTTPLLREKVQKKKKKSPSMPTVRVEEWVWGCRDFVLAAHPKEKKW